MIKQDSLLHFETSAPDLPSRVFVQLIEDCLLTKLKHQVEASFPPEDLQQIDQIHMFQLLQTQQENMDKVSVLKRPNY